MSTNYRKIFFGLSFITLLLIVLSCQKLSSNLGWETNLKVPVIHSLLGVDDIFTDSILVENPDQSWKLVFNQKVIAFDNNALIEVHDTLSQDIFSIPIYFKVNPGQKVIEQTSNYQMDLGDMELTMARARNAELKFLVTNTIRQPLLVEYEVISSEKNGISFTVSDSVPAADANGPSQMVKTINLAYYNMDFTGPNHDRSNIVSSKTTVYIHPNADTVWVTPADCIIVASIFNKLDMDYAKGYFGQTAENIIDSSFLSTFNSFKKGSFDLKNATAELRINNYIGADIQFRIQEISSVNNETGITIPLDAPVVGKSLNIMRATETGDTNNPVVPKKYAYSLNNTNIPDLIENQPDLIRYRMKYDLNPLGNISGGNDFIYADKSIEGFIHMEVPLNVSMDSLVIESSSAYSFDAEGKIKSGNLIISADNFFPYDVEIQFYLLDENNNIVDSLLHDNIKSVHGIMDNNGYVIKSVHSDLVIKMDDELLRKMRENNRMLIWARIDSDGKGTVSLYHHYNVDITLIVEADYEL